MLLACFLLLSLFLIKAATQIPELKVGILIPSGTNVDKDVGFYGSAGAIPVALKKAYQLQLYDPKLYNISFVWDFSECDQTKTAGAAAQMITRDNVSAILGPVCPDSARIVASMSAYKKVLMFPWGVAAPYDFFDNPQYSTTLPMSGTVRGLVTALGNVLANFNWTEIAFVYSRVDVINETIPICGSLNTLFETGSTYLGASTDVYTRQAQETTIQSFHNILEDLKTRSRIIVTCLETTQAKRNLMKAAAALNMLDESYVFIFIQSNAAGFGSPPFWATGGKSDEMLKEAAKNVFVLDKYTNGTQEGAGVAQDMLDGIKGWPFYCTNCSNNRNVSQLGVYLGDAFLTYLGLLNRTYTTSGTRDLRNASALLAPFKNTTYLMPSIFTPSFTLTRGIRLTRYALQGLNAESQVVVWAMVHSLQTTDYSVFNATYSDPATSIWATRKGKTPLSTPMCGFRGEKCVASPWVYTLLSVGLVMSFLLIVIALYLAIFCFQRQQRGRLNALWQINHHQLGKLENRTVSTSTRSVQSNASSLINKKTDQTEFFHLNAEIVVAKKRSYYGSFSSAEQEEFRQMRTLEHVNLNRFLGVAVVDHSTFFLWDYCERGSLMEVIEEHLFRIDGFVMLCMIKDVIEGLFYIHNSPFLQHGNLSSYSCLVGDRFEVKIQLYGLSGNKVRTTRELDDKSTLFVAPEHLQGTQNMVGSQAGDIYSLAIIASTILTMKPAFAYEKEFETEDSLITKIKRGDYPVTRPSLEHLDPSAPENPELLELIRHCMAERPTERLSIGEIRQFFSKKIFTAKRVNIMDHMFALMEDTAAELEQHVQQQTLELIGEQRKSDALLNRMMPKEAWEKLKLGEMVTPELFDTCTVFFSDIVGFTTIASKSTALQMIAFLNEVFTMADEVVEAFDAYKASIPREFVETIGDGLHVVSGIPKRNGVGHAKAIAEMAIAFQRAIKTLRLAHMPAHVVQMRIGVHSGSAVAGIVGMTAPRYCVFGDTVNIAAKMEASGQPGRIHVSPTTKALIDQHFPAEFSFASRGESLIKGVGTMHTFFLVPPEEAASFQV